MLAFTRNKEGKDDSHTPHISLRSEFLSIAYFRSDEDMIDAAEFIIEITIITSIDQLHDSDVREEYFDVTLINVQSVLDYDAFGTQIFVDQVSIVQL